ncbi:GFA family protein [Alphaproteobacteria bacterium]|nr:GFA family protein [Alphaproteobacteria bacterium]
MKYNVSCHCGKVKLLIETDLKILKQCNCSICKRKNAKMNILPKEAIVSISGEENLSTYQFGTNVAKHYFCKNCGIYTHHQRKSDPNGIGVNIGCIDDIDSFQYDVDVLDMKSK